MNVKSITTLFSIISVTSKIWAKVALVLSLTSDYPHHLPSSPVPTTQASCFCPYSHNHHTPTCFPLLLAPSPSTSSPNYNPETTLLPQPNNLYSSESTITNHHHPTTLEPNFLPFISTHPSLSPKPAIVFNPPVQPLPAHPHQPRSPLSPTTRPHHQLKCLINPDPTYFVFLQCMLHWVVRFRHQSGQKYRWVECAPMYGVQIYDGLSKMLSEMAGWTRFVPR